MIANRICWRACFVSICLPTCYPCYICRTVRRRRRQGDVQKREELLTRNKNKRLVEGFDNCMNRTLLSQVSEVKNRNKTASLENKLKPSLGAPEKTVPDSEDPE